MKKLSILFAALIVSISSIFAAEEVYKTISFSTDNKTRGKGVSDYSKSWQSTTNGFTVDIVNFNNNNWDKDWAYIRCGSKKAASVATITTNAAIDKAITKVVVTLDAVTAANLDSTILTVASDNKFTENVQTIKVTATKGELPYVVTTPAENMYYKLTYACKKGSGNGFVQISKIEYYTSIADVEATAIALDQTALELEQYKNAKLTATLTPVDATTTVTWASSNEAVATVSSKGVISALTTGTTTITATAGELTATCAITVKEATAITCAQAVEIAKTVSANNEVAAGGKYVIRGYVTALQGTPATDFEKFGNYSVWMADTKDGGKVFEAYQVAPTDGKTIAAVGDYVEVIGDITKYNTTYETVGKTGTITVIAEPVEPTTPAYCQTEVGHFLAENADPNSYVLLSIGSKDGKTIVRIDQDTEKNTKMFDYLQVTGLVTAGADVTEGGEKAMAVEFDTPAADAEGNITLEILWSTIGWEGRWMIQNLKVSATAECEHAVLVGPGSAINNATIESNVVKRIENGVLVIEKDGVRYNAQGVKLN